MICVRMTHRLMAFFFSCSSIVLLYATTPLPVETEYTKAAHTIFKTCLTLDHEATTKNLYPNEIIDTIANITLSNDNNDYWQALELAVKNKHWQIAHGLAKKYICNHAKQPLPLFLQEICTTFSTEAQDIIRMHYFLMYNDKSVMTYTNQQGVSVILSLGFNDLFYEKIYLIDNGKMTFKNKFLSALNDFAHPTVYVDKIDVSNNFLCDLPDDMASIPSVKTIDISYNFFTKIPLCISAMAYLEVLKIHHNTITELPSSLGTLKNLYRLEASTNQLQTLPEELSACSNLRLLDLSDNLISVLPSCILHLPKLEKLNLTNNKLSSIPPELAWITTLRILRIKGNPLKKLPAAFKRIPYIEKDDQVVFDDV